MRKPFSIVLGVVVFAACASCSRSAETSWVERKIIELDRDKDGSPDFRMENFVRGKEKVLQVLRRKQKGIWSETRSYFSKGKQVVIEEDSEGDGIFENLVVLSGSEIEVFLRKQDGSVSVASASARKAYRKMFFATEKFWNNSFKAMDEKEIGASFDKTQKEIEAAAETLPRGEKR